MKNASRSVGHRRLGPARYDDGRSPELLHFEERVHVFVGGERDQVVDPFADADVTDRQFQIVRDRDDDAAFGGAVELCEDDAVDAGDRS